MNERELTLKQARWVEFYLGEASGNATEAARRAGYGANEDGLRVIGCQNLTKLNIRQRIQARLSDERVTSNEVINTLADHMRGDVTELFDEAGVLDLQTIRERGLGHLIKKIKRTRRYEGRGEDRQPVDELELELNNQQSAAAQLCKVLGIEKQPGANPIDEEARIDAAVARVMSLTGCDLVIAQEAVRAQPEFKELGRID